METSTNLSETIQMFGELDRQANGKISSEYPAWTNKVHIEHLREDIRQIEWALDNKRIPHEKVYNESQKLNMLKGKLESIERAKPHLSDPEKDRLMKMYKHFGKEITLLLPTVTSYRKGLSTPHKELEVMQHPCITVPSEFQEQVLALNTPILGGKVSRNQASRVWKILGNLLDEPTNVEYLRKDK